jgi:hypothetical protein
MAEDETTDRQIAQQRRAPARTRAVKFGRKPKLSDFRRRGLFGARRRRLPRTLRRKSAYFHAQHCHTGSEMPTYPSPKSFNWSHNILTRIIGNELLATNGVSCVFMGESCANCVAFWCSRRLETRPSFEKGPHLDLETRWSRVACIARRWTHASIIVAALANAHIRIR